MANAFQWPLTQCTSTGGVIGRGTAADLAPSGAVTLSLAQVQNGDIAVASATSARTLTLPTATILGGWLGTTGSGKLRIRNTSSTLPTLIAAGTGGTLYSDLGGSIPPGQIADIEFTQTSASAYVATLTLRKTTVKTTITTAGAVTLTVAHLAPGYIEADPNGAGRAYTTPTAALLATLLGADGCQFDCVLKNTADAAETITITAGSGCTLKEVVANGEAVAQNEQVLMRFVRTGSGAYDLYLAKYVNV